MLIEAIILGFAALISCQYAPPFRVNSPIFPAQVYGPPELAPPAAIYGPPAPPPFFSPLFPPLLTSETNLVPPQFSPAAAVAGSHGSSSVQVGLFSGFAPPVSTAGAEASTSAQTSAGGFSFAASPQFTAVPATPSSQYGTPTFKK